MKDDRNNGRYNISYRRVVTNPDTETHRMVERYTITTDEQYKEYKAQGGCGKPASLYSLYCDNHAHLHRDDAMTPVFQAVDNRPGQRQLVKMCSHIVSANTPKPSNITAPTAPTATPTTNAQKDKDSIMSTATTTNVTPNLSNVPQDLLAALLAALQTPTTPATTTPATATPATTALTQYKNTPAYEMVPNIPTVITITGFVDVTFTAKPTVFKTGNVGYTGSTKGTCRHNGKDYQVSINISEIHRKEKDAK